MSSCEKSDILTTFVVFFESPFTWGIELKNQFPKVLNIIINIINIINK